MKRRKKVNLATAAVAIKMTQIGLILMLFAVSGGDSMLMMMMKTNCLTSSPSCVCTWKGGKFVADCSQQNLSKVPNNDYYESLNSNAASSGSNQMSTLNRDIQQLHLTSNNITQLASQEFNRKKFKNLQKIYLNTNQIQKIHPKSFYKLIGLIELDLSENLLSNLEYDYKNSQPTDQDEEDDNKPNTSQSNGSSFLTHLSQLRTLNLASNQLKRIDKFAFSSLTQLRQLILSNNRINYFDKRALDGLGLLNILHLDGNKLSHLDGELLFKLPQLHSLQLAGSNPWRCDCKLRKLVRLLVPKFLQESLPKQQQQQQDQMRMATNAAAKILQDEPQCRDSHLFQRHGSASENTDVVVSGPVDRQTASGAAESGEQTNQLAATGATAAANEPGGGIVWTNMRLADFQCEPKLVASLMAPTKSATNSSARRNSRSTLASGNDNNNNNSICNEKQMENHHSASLAAAAASDQIIARRLPTTGAASSQSQSLPLNDAPVGLATESPSTSATDNHELAAEAQAISRNMSDRSNEPRGGLSREPQQDVARSEDFGDEDDGINRGDDKSGILLDTNNQHNGELKRPNGRKLRGRNDGHAAAAASVERRARLLINNGDHDAVGGYVRTKLRAKRSGNDEGDEQSGDPTSENDQPPTSARQKQTIVSMEQEYLPSEPIELTCPLDLTDELDLDLIQIEWWLLDSNGSLTLGEGFAHQQQKPPTLLWRSSLLQTPAPATENKNKPKAGGTNNSDRQLRLLVDSLEGREFAVIDYVTRANKSASSASGGQTQTGSDNDDANDAADIDHQETEVEAKTVITRVEHLIIDSASSPLITRRQIGAKQREDEEDDPNERLERFFLCRITNSIGQLDVLFPIVIDGSSLVAKQQSRRRLAMRKRVVAPLRLDFNQVLAASASQVPKYPFTGGGFLGGLARAKMSLRRELDKTMGYNGTRNDTQLFIPIHLPDDLIKIDRQSSAQSSSLSSSQARSFNLNSQTDHQTRPTTRQTNATSSTNGTAQLVTARITHAPSQPEADDQATGSRATNSTLKSSKSSLRSLSLNLIGRYTSNKLSLVDMSEHQDEALNDIDYSESSEQNLSGIHSDNKPTIDRLKSLLAHFNGRFFNGWLHVMARDAPLIIGICAGLLIGCFITTLVVFRLKCDRQRRVGDSCKGNKRQVAFKKEHHPNKRRKLKMEDIECYGDDEHEDDEEYEEEEEEDSEDQDGDSDGENEEPDGSGQLATISGSLVGNQRKLAGQQQPHQLQGKRKLMASGNSSSSATNDSQRRLIISSDESHELHTSNSICFGPNVCTAGNGFLATTSCGGGAGGLTGNGLPGNNNSDKVATLRRGKRVQIDGSCMSAASLAMSAAKESRFLDCSCQSTADEVNDGDVSGVSNLEDSILSQPCISVQANNFALAGQLASGGSRAPSDNSNSLLLSLPGESEARYIVVAQHPANDSSYLQQDQDGSSPSTYGCSHSQQTGQLIYGSSNSYQDQGFASSTGEYYPTVQQQQQQVVIGKLESHYVVNPPKLRSINEDTLCLLPYVPSPELEANQIQVHLPHSNSFIATSDTNYGDGIYYTAARSQQNNGHYGTTGRIQHHQQPQQQMTMFNCSSSITSPGASTSSSGNGYSSQPPVTSYPAQGHASASLDRRARNSGGNNIVSLDDALQLLHNSMENCRPYEAKNRVYENK